MDYNSLEKFKHCDFDNFFKLMRESFPSIERRSFEDQKKLLFEDSYNIVLDKDEKENIIAIMSIWEFSGFNFIEHFAVDSRMRGNGRGTSILKNYLNKCDKPIFLEVEPPENDISMRRIEFYKRLGFHLNSFEYLQPPLQKKHDFLPLMVMSYPRSVDNIEFTDFKNIVYDKVYKNNSTERIDK
jgi:ribosomal protein S18 acetylase RimI-like enzyme